MDLFPVPLLYCIFFLIGSYKFSFFFIVAPEICVIIFKRNKNGKNVKIKKKLVTDKKLSFNLNFGI